MADPVSHDTKIEVPAGHDSGGSPGVINVSGSMMALTYVTFILTALVLYKVAWKPILALLEKRENSLRKALEDSESLRAEMAQIEDTRNRIVKEAEQQARAIIDQGRRAAVDAAHAIEAKAREESQILLENARREIRAEADKAMAALRQESTELAIGITRKILQEHLDENRGREIADTLIRQI